MAILRKDKEIQAIKKERMRQDTLKRKMEILQKKMDFGESWRYAISQQQRAELEELVGDLDTPTLVDFVDLNQYFNVVAFYKSKQGDKIDFDYNKYLSSEEAYQDILEDLDKELYADDSEDEKTLREQVVEDIKKKDEQERRMSLRFVIKIPKILQDKYQQWTLYFRRVVPVYNKYICSCCGRPLDISNFYPQYVETNMGRIEFDGKMHSHICLDCSKRLYEYLYYEKAGKDPCEAMKWFCSYLNLYFEENIYYRARQNMEKNGKRNHIVFEFLELLSMESDYKYRTFLESPHIGVKKQSIEAPKTLKEKNDDVADLIKKLASFEDAIKANVKNQKAIINNQEVLEKYAKAQDLILNPIPEKRRPRGRPKLKAELPDLKPVKTEDELPDLTKVDFDKLMKQITNIINTQKITDIGGIIPADMVDWMPQDISNYRMVVKMVGYDPFDWETDENRKILYSNLLGMLDEGMEQDEVKLQAAIQIVISYLRVGELNKQQRQKERDGASAVELKAISDLKAKEMNAITQFAKDNGFSERYSIAKSKGENSFTGIMNKMDETKFEDALVNKYDIATSSTIQQAADASFKAIMSQLSLGEAEVWQTCAEQLKTIDELRRENMTLTENLRTTKYELAKMNLEKEAMERNVGKDDIFGGGGYD